MKKCAEQIRILIDIIIQSVYTITMPNMKLPRFLGILFVSCFLIAMVYFIPACDSIAGGKNKVPEKIPAASLQEKATPVLGEGNVIGVVDNNLIKVNISGKEYTVRYIGVSTLVPYRHSKSIEYYNEECQRKNRELVSNKTVRLEKDISETDKSGYLLRYVWVDNVMINAELVRQGYAMVMGAPPDFKHYNMLVKLQQQAQSEGRGFWAEENENLKIQLVPEEVYGDSVAKIYHYTYCRIINDIANKEQRWYLIYFNSWRAAKEAGYKPCTVCKPPQ